MTTEVLNIKILGMTCEGCEKTIIEALKKLKGVSKVSIYRRYFKMTRRSFSDKEFRCKISGKS